MRCLHCNKKLSLLKLAKGDSFCSPEHFDAYQLQLSRSAYDRLISVPEEDAPKPPLILKKFTEEAEQSRDLEADSALARLAVFRAPEKKEAAFQAPPYAPFLASPPPYCPPNPAVLAAAEAEGNEPVEAARDLSFPVHDVQATVCILHLYLRLGLAETPARNWAREREIIADPESFLGEITRPKLPVGPNVVENRGETDAPSLEEAVSIEPLLPAEGQLVLEPEQPVEILLEKDEPVGFPPPPEAVPSNEPVPEPEFVEYETPTLAAGILTPVEALPLSEPALEPRFVEYDMPMLPLCSDIETALEAVSSGEAALEPETVKREMPMLVLGPDVEIAEIPPQVEAVSLNEPVLEPETGELVAAATPAQVPVEHEKRLPFLVAPSFGGRDWDALPFDATASSAPRDWTLAPALDTMQAPDEAWSGVIASSIGFAGIPPLQPKDADGRPIQSGFALTAATVPLLPHETAIESYGWHASSGPLGIGRPAFEMIRVSTRAIDFVPPSPAPARPNATLTPGHRIRIPAAAGIDSLARSVLETSPRGQKPAPVISQLGAMECGLSAILAPLPAWEGSSPALRNQAPHVSRGSALADSAGPVEFTPEPLRYTPDCGKDLKQDAVGEPAPSVAMRPCHLTEWRRTDCAPPAGADPAPTGWEPTVRRLTTTGVWDSLKLAGNTVFRAVLERRFTSAASSVFGHLESTVLAPPALPTAVDIPVRDWRIGLCAPTATWNPCLPVIPNRPLAFLPARGSAVLPSARSWPRLGALAR
jgi:hypothetical protein